MECNEEDNHKKGALKRWKWLWIKVRRLKFGVDRFFRVPGRHNKSPWIRGVRKRLFVARRHPLLVYWRYSYAILLPAAIVPVSAMRPVTVAWAVIYRTVVSRPIIGGWIIRYSVVAANSYTWRINTYRYMRPAPAMPATPWACAGNIAISYNQQHRYKDACKNSSFHTF